MSRERVYPDEPAGPFPEPPLTFEDREGREIEVRASPPGADVPDALVEMYVAFDPVDRAQGIPPTDEAAIRNWLETIYAEGYNAVAWHGDAAAGHATLVPDGGGKASTAGEPARQGAATAGDDDAASHGPHELAIFVLQSYQRAGVGTRLLEGLLGHGRANGVERVWLSVERWNDPAIGLYRAVGFETADTGSFELEMAIRL